MMKTKTEKNGNVLNVTLEGRLDTTTAEQFLETVEQQIDEQTTTLCLDCSQLEYVSSAGLRVLMSLDEDMSANDGKVRLEHVTDQVLEVLRLTGMNEIFEL